jgi:hypothetical protein
LGCLVEVFIPLRAGHFLDGVSNDIAFGDFEFDWLGLTENRNSYCV